MGCQIARKPDYSAAHDANHNRLIALLSAILAAAALRLVPHPPNFTPIGAMALFSGAYLGRRRWPSSRRSAALLLSDLVLGFYHGMATVYFSVALIVIIGWWLQRAHGASRRRRRDRQLGPILRHHQFRNVAV